MWGTPRQMSVSTRQINHTRIEEDNDIEEFYELGKCLGKGSFGTVLHARRQNGDKSWAIKAINKEKAGSAGVKLLEREVSIMKRVHHPDIIHLEEVYESSKKMFLVMEICDLGGLDELLKNRGCFTEIETRSIMKQLADAISYLHDNDIIHRDLKLENILLSHPVNNDEPINIKITDFGLSYIRGGMGSDYMMQQVCGTPMYMAPEVINNLGYSQQCDIWSMGVIMFTLVTGSPPFNGTTEEKLYESIRKAEIEFNHPQWQEYTTGARQLIEGMLKADPAHRFTSKEVLNHPWLTGESCENGQVFNVLEMMKLYNLEQKKINDGLLAGRPKTWWSMVQQKLYNDRHVLRKSFPLTGLGSVPVRLGNSTWQWCKVLNMGTPQAKMESEGITAENETEEINEADLVEKEDINANVSLEPPARPASKSPRSSDTGKQTTNNKSSTTKLRTSRSTVQSGSSKTSVQLEQGKVGSSEKKNSRSNPVPSYMMPTKSSGAPKNPNRKENKKR